MIVDIKEVQVTRQLVTLKCKDCQKSFEYLLAFKEAPKEWPYVWVRSSVKDIPYYVWEAVHIFSHFEYGHWVCNRCSDKTRRGD